LITTPIAAGMAGDEPVGEGFVGSLTSAAVVPASVSIAVDTAHGSHAEQPAMANIVRAKARGRPVEQSLPACRRDARRRFASAIARGLQAGDVVALECQQESSAASAASAASILAGDQ